MMIGGVDIIIPTEDGPLQQMVAAIEAAKRIWPHSVVGRSWSEAFDAFVYRDQDAMTALGRLGVVPELADAMIHVLAREGELTLVIDDPESEPIKTFLSDIRHRLARRLSDNGSTRLS